MSHGVKRDTYINADPDTTKALTYDMLDHIAGKVDEIKTIYEGHLGACDIRFKKLENKKKRDTAISAISGGIGGFLAIATKWVKDLF